VEVFRPSSLPEALEIRAAHPEALPIAGGTDVMVERTFGRRRPAGILDVSRLPELREIRREGATVFLTTALAHRMAVVRGVGPADLALRGGRVAQLVPSPPLNARQIHNRPNGTSDAALESGRVRTQHGCQTTSV
jgi:hypothetical protein